MKIFKMQSDNAEAQKSIIGLKIIQGAKIVLLIGAVILLCIALFKNKDSTVASPWLFFGLLSWVGCLAVSIYSRSQCTGIPLTDVQEKNVRDEVSEWLIGEIVIVALAMFVHLSIYAKIMGGYGDMFSSWIS